MKLHAQLNCAVLATLCLAAAVAGQLFPIAPFPLLRAYSEVQAEREYNASLQSSMNDLLMRQALVEEMQEQQSQIDAGTDASCPENFNLLEMVGPGCSCNPVPSTGQGTCPAGYVCAEPWSQRLLEAAQATDRSVPMNTVNLAASPDGDYPDFTCSPCTYGQICRQGSVLPTLSSKSNVDVALRSLACPAGYFCPTPREIYECPTGFYCPQGTVQPLTCNMTTLVGVYPSAVMPVKPTTVYESVYLRGTILGGNQCPGNSTTPQTPCTAGFYCPTPTESYICPAGYFCKKGSVEPTACPAMASCPEGSVKASLSWFGFVCLVVILIGLWLAYWLMVALIAINQRKLSRTQSARERLWKLLNPLLASNSSKSKSFRAFRAIRPRITFEFENMGLTLRGGKTILSGVTGSFHHSRIAAIMGPSGAGKSTFLNVIMGKGGSMGEVTGTIKANGREIKPGQDLQGIVGLVPQEDIVHEDLTVRENLVFNARLRLSKTKSVQEQMLIVEDVISVLQLRHVQHQVVGNAEKRGISGGQRKRVNIGWELVSKPSVLFMDEPTSGLDATAASDILQGLKKMSSLGMNIITVIHQPRYSIFSLFDDVMLLCKGGMLAYLGPSQLALDYLEELGFPLPKNENPADFALDVLSGVVPRIGHATFQPEQLVPQWASFGKKWIAAKDTPALRRMMRGDVAERGPEAIDPEQLMILEDVIDDKDADGDGVINKIELGLILKELGCEPTSEDLETIYLDLANESTGLISKSDILQYVRFGGRPPALPASDPKEASKDIRRLDSLYRVYSIEQYTMTNALSEMTDQMPQGMKAPGPIENPMTLREMAIASMERIDSSKELPDGLRGGDETPDLGTVESLDLAGETYDDAASDANDVDNAKRMESLKSVESSADLNLASRTGSRALQSRGLFSLFRRKAKLRETPGLFSQLFILFTREVTQWTRGWMTKFMDIMLLVVAAVTCGAIHGTGTGPNDVRGNSALVLLTMGILACTTSLGVFGKDKLVFWREKDNGLRVFPYFAAKTLINLVDITIQPLIFIAIYDSMTLPSISFGMYYLIALLVVWWTTSAGTLISVLVSDQSNALVAAVAFVLITGGFINGVSPNYKELGDFTKALTSLSYNRWAVESVTVASYGNYPEYMWPLSKALMNVAGYCGLDENEVPSINKSLRGDVIIASDAPSWDDEWQQADVIDPNMSTSEIQELDINVYCSGYLERNLIILACEGLILRLLTLLALYVCPKGLSLEPVAAPIGRLFSSLKKKLVTKKKAAVRKRTSVAISRNV